MEVNILVCSLSRTDLTACVGRTHGAIHLHLEVIKVLRSCSRFLMGDTALVRML